VADIESLNGLLYVLLIMKTIGRNSRNCAWPRFYGFWL